MSTSLKSLTQIVVDVMDQTIKSNIGDLKTGSVIDTYLEAENIVRAEQKKIILIRFLAKLDNRFNKHISPWAELELAQRYFSKL